MKRLFSGIQPSGEVHLGNYLGAIKNWVELQEDNKLMLCVVDLHAITVPQDPNALRAGSIDLARMLIACGINPDKTIIFKQSDVAAHSELAWILSTITSMGELNRMTQFKDKSKKGDSSKASVGLFTYPVLQAADVLLYDINAVPVGEDQKQHLELMRDLAERFNKRYGQTFVVPEAKISNLGARVMGLDNPEVKMSKSAGPNNYIGLLDSPEQVQKKVSRAVTDSKEGITADPARRGLYNLLVIEAALNGTTVEEEAREQKFKGFADYKNHVAEVVTTVLKPIQGKYRSITEKEVSDILKQGAVQANEAADKKLQHVKKAIGLL